VEVLVRSCDVRREASVRRFIEAVRGRFGRIDILVNNAGIASPPAPVGELAFEDWANSLATNLSGMFLCTRAALPLMRGGSTIVNNLSVAARTAFPGQSAYVAAKHGARGFTDVLREELRGRGIRVIGLYPGATNTKLWEQFWPEAPRRKMMTPETIARAVVDALILPEGTTVEELVIAPTAGKL
jgi:NAD(P)-dependent dehydrogenase (short-subunit alcohol dehydrogenase family)